MNISRRLSFIRAYVSHYRNFPFPFADLISGMFRLPCTQLAPLKITALHTEGDYLSVRLDGFSRSLCWPKALPLYKLYMVITEGLYANDWHYYEVPETRVMPGDVVLDCGAAEGLFSLAVVERAQQVVAFEPLLSFVASLNQTFDGVANVNVVPLALGSASGKAFLTTGTIDSHISDSKDGQPVLVTTIDEWIEQNKLERVDYIKGDLEGFEMEVLRGAKDTIKLFKPKIAFTTYHYRNDWKEMVAFCRDLVPEYKFRVKGISYMNPPSVQPVMLHLWI